MASGAAAVDGKEILRSQTQSLWWPRWGQRWPGQQACLGSATGALCQVRFKGALGLNIPFSASLGTPALATHQLPGLGSLMSPCAKRKEDQSPPDLCARPTGTGGGGCLLCSSRLLSVLLRGASRVVPLMVVALLPLKSWREREDVLSLHEP